MAIIVATYVLRSVTLTFGLTGSGFVYRFFPIEFGLFLAGVLSQRVCAQLEFRNVMRFPISLAVSAVFLALVLVQQYVDRLDNHKFYILVLLALPALFDVSRRIRLDGWFGELSYPIYLAHLSVLSFGQVITTTVTGPLEDKNWFVIGMVAVTILMSIAYVHWIDAPFERWRQGRAKRGKQQRASGPLSHRQQATLSV